MCGISGFVDFAKKSSAEHLKKMSDTLVHRGPDGDGYHFNETTKATIGLAHRRLSIIDLSEGGKQPQTFEHLTITYNGEIYNYQEIKYRLIQKGHSFSSHSDTEVILHGFMEWGPAVVDQCIGMFAFVIHDTKNNQLFCCRDRAGVKPFFYYHTNDIFLFASELKAILAHPAFVKELNRDAVGAYLQFGYVPHTALHL
ncbi:asparagine synthetase [glutamine-hydrolyzing] 3 [Filimonas sp.]|nr:asparagine synthetase [glutamine-hydrolyzing] 3 [Filimonas sp.]